ncbi:hypothetical protein LUX34_01815 [Streptomyces werraensis]|nr:hypothetical protein [Streptomyces werraensis]
MFALLEAHGVPASEADDLVSRGGRWGQCEVVELGGMTPPLGARFSDGWMTA